MGCIIIQCHFLILYRSLNFLISFKKTLGACCFPSKNQINGESSCNCQLPVHKTFSISWDSFSAMAALDEEKVGENKLSLPASVCQCVLWQFWRCTGSLISSRWRSSRCNSPQQPFHGTNWPEHAMWCECNSPTNKTTKQPPTTRQPTTKNTTHIFSKLLILKRGRSPSSCLCSGDQGRAFAWRVEDRLASQPLLFS